MVYFSQQNITVSKIIVQSKFEKKSPDLIAYSTDVRCPMDRTSLRHFTFAGKYNDIHPAELCRNEIPCLHGNNITLKMTLHLNWAWRDQNYVEEQWTKCGSCIPYTNILLTVMQLDFNNSIACRIDQIPIIKPVKRTCGIVKGININWSTIQIIF